MLFMRLSDPTARGFLCTTRRASVSALVLAAAAVGSSASAATWNTGSGLWGTASNWTPSGIPTQNTEVDFANVVTSDSPVVVDLGGPRGGLKAVFQANANSYYLMTANDADYLQLGGTPVSNNTEYLFVDMQAGVTNDQTINVRIRPAASASGVTCTFRNDSTTSLLTLGRNINAQTGSLGTANVKFDGDGDITVGGRIGHTTGNANIANLTKLGGGTLTIQDSGITTPHLFSGTTTVDGGTLIVNGVLETSASAVNVNTGASLGGTGTIRRPVNILGGYLKPGVGTGMLSVSSLTLDSSAETDFDLAGLIRGDATDGYDAVDVSGALVLDGVMKVSLTGGFDPAAGSSFDLFNWGTIDASGFNVATDLQLPSLSGDRTWDTSEFLTTGTVSVVLVPEPGAMGLVLLGLSTTSLLRRRKLRR